jgi:hypothetical protein
LPVSAVAAYDGPRRTRHMIFFGWNGRPAVFFKGDYLGLDFRPGSIDTNTIEGFWSTFKDERKIYAALCCRVPIPL